MHTSTDKKHTVKTRFFIISDTHGEPLTISTQGVKADVAIHCGDLTEHSTIQELRITLQLLKEIDAPIKLVIAGNHDFTLDEDAFQKKLAEGDRIAGETLDRSLVKQTFGEFGVARKMLQDAKDDYGIVFLDEGMHRFFLENGAELSVFASPYTPSNGGDWAYQYAAKDHLFDIAINTSVVVTHGPPHGILDRTSDRKRIGCPELFSALATTQPLMHCFGHVHHGWGAKFVSWRTTISDAPSHFTDIDNEQSFLLDSLTSLKQSGTCVNDDQRQCRETSHCLGDEHPLTNGKTLFVNASIKGDDGKSHLPWIVEIDLPVGEA